MINNPFSNLLKQIRNIFLWFLLIVVLTNILAPLYCKKPDEKFEETLKQAEFTSDTPGRERIRCVDDNEEALLWRLRMIEAAKKNIVLSTFDLRADESGTDLLAALNHAAPKGMKIKLLIDGIYQQLFLNKSKEFQALVTRENVQVGVYNPITPASLLKINYRMHDKYLIVDNEMYLLGGRNSNDIFLGDKTTGINMDRDILVYDTTKGQGESLQELEVYFQQIWNEDCVKLKGGRKKNSSEISVPEEAADEIPANKITLINNGTQDGPKTPLVLQTIKYLSQDADRIIIQTPYVICNGYMYDTLRETASHAKLQIVLNAVEKNSNPWGCTDYLKQNKKILSRKKKLFYGVYSGAAP